MSEKEETLLKQFSQLFDHGQLMYLLMQSRRRQGDWRENMRGPQRLLRLMKDKPEWTNAEISEALDIKPSSVSALVSRLEEAELVERHASAQDGRVMLISLTEKGKHVIADAENSHETEATKVFAALTEEEQTELSALMAKLLKDLDDQDTVNEAAGWEPPFTGRGFGGRGPWNGGRPGPWNGGRPGQGAWNGRPAQGSWHGRGGQGFGPGAWQQGRGPQDFGGRGFDGREQDDFDDKPRA
ncbi:MarR family winged helix-turn-helix transcriptional regulator [Lacticaseibacillus yichunensis]|uniref:MarR family winged helix-turn-helix transcriptional regulator n=1 Tax=Lacticaseibacillus yichunensis TaxID=2486015 RepID=A0ABW4CSC5_9LACO|nr:MarR family winged helix-turn-helix transcriptional regulator [Lacticaseibacillus yichunensis]